MGSLLLHSIVRTVTNDIGPTAVQSTRTGFS
jgi:hypothetical protein